MTDKQFQLLFYAVRLAHPSVDVTARIPLAIAKLETGNFTSNHFVTHHNLFGMTAPDLRETNALNKGTGQVAVFDSLFDGMSDFFLFCEQLNLKTDGALQKRIDELKYNKNPKYPATIAGIVASVQAKGGYLPAALFHPVVVGGAAAVSVGAIYAAYSALND